MPNIVQNADYIHSLRGLLTGTVGQGRRDLNLRQLAMVLVTYVSQEKQTVRGLAATLAVSRPAVSRALDRLAALRLITREIDPRDRRSIRVGLTRQGVAYVRELRNAGLVGWHKAAQDLRRLESETPPPPPQAVHLGLGSGEARRVEQRRKRRDL